MKRRPEILDDAKTFSGPPAPVAQNPHDEKETILTLDSSFERKIEKIRVSDPFINITIDGRYQLHERIGEGGMGAVYRATHLLMNKPVAIKLISAELTHLPQVVGRFEREARSASRLSHPNCITVTDFGRNEDGTLFLVMELMEGQSLQDILSREHTLAAPRAVEITKQILSGLAHAHEAGIVHRDLKPSNVMIVRQGERDDFAKVFDFGIAKITEDSGADSKLTQQGMIVGTPAYLSPEQALGDDADNRSDLYAVGVMLYEMLTGDVPYKGTIAMDVVTAHVSAEIPTLDPTRPYPLGLRKIIERAMAKKPDERFQSAAEFLSAMENLDFNRIEYGNRRKLRAGSVLRFTALTGFGAALIAGAFYGREMLETRQRAEIQQEVTVSAPEDTSPKEPILEVNEKQVADLLGEVEEQIRLGIPSEAVHTARRALEMAPDEPPVHLLLGHALFLSGKRPEAMVEYQTALDAKRELAEDKRLQAHLEDALKFEATATPAAEMLAKFGGEQGLALLRERANSPLADRTERSSARRALIAEEGEQAVDWLATLTADFNDFKACKKRRQIVSQMEKTNDPRFLPLLEAQRPWNKINGCIKAEVEHAIQTLHRAAEHRRSVSASDTESPSVEEAP